MIKYIISAIILLSLGSCAKMPMDPDPCPPNCPEDSIDYPLDIVWETYYYNDTLPVAMNGQPTTYKNNILFCGDDYHGEGYYHTYMFDKTSGELQHIFDGYLNVVDILTIIDHYLVTTALDGLRVYDLDTYELVGHKEGKYIPKHSSFGDDVYAIRVYTELPFLDSVSLIKVNIPSMVEEKLITVEKDSINDLFELVPVNFEVVEGDTLLYGVYNNTGYSYLYAYNQTKRIYEWKTDIDARDGYFNQVVMDEDKIYLSCGHKGRAFDKQTGEQVWETYMRFKVDGDNSTLFGWYRGNKPVLKDGRIFFKAVGYALYCLDTSTGQIIWLNKKTGSGNFHSPAYYDNKLLFSNLSHLLVIDAITGKELFKAEGPYDKWDIDKPEISRREYSKFSAIAPIIDEANGVFFLSDDNRMFCFRIPDEW